MTLRGGFKTQRLIHTDDSIIPLILRVFLGTILFSQSTLCFLEDPIFSQKISTFSNIPELHWLIYLLFIIMESLGAVALIIGFATRIIALSYVVITLYLIITSNAPDGFNTFWQGYSAENNIGFCLLWMAISISLFISGGGGYSFDKEFLMEKRGGNNLI